MSQLTTQYVKQLKHLHRTTDFGSGGAKVPKVLQPYLSNVKSLLDFGCGKGKFSQTIKDFNSNINVYSYDPVTAPIELPEQVDVVYSSDVLEHVEPELLDNVLQHIDSCILLLVFQPCHSRCLLATQLPDVQSYRQVVLGLLFLI